MAASLFFVGYLMTVEQELTPSSRAFELYQEVMEIFGTSHVSGVFSTGIPDVTTVFVHDLVSNLHDLWFYRFTHSRLPVLEILEQGKVMIRRGPEAVLSEKALIVTLSDLVTQIRERRNQMCLLETGLPWDVATGAVAPPVDNSKKRKPYTTKQKG